MIPYHLDGGDVETLVGGVNESQGRAEAHHVELGIALREESALESGMDAAHDGVVAEEFLVRGNHDLLQFGVGTHLPGGIAVRRDSLSACEFEDGLNGGAHIVEVRHDVGALA